ncbi:MAG: Crp/Fnr family transcriptional regulator [Thermodesulfobacteriota bacterium]
MHQENYLKTLGEAMNFGEGIPEEQWLILFKRAKEKHLKANEIFLMAGDIPHYIGYVVSGLLRLYYLDTEGKEVTKHFATENTFAISYSAFLQREESRFSIQALEDTSLLLFDYQTYIDMLKSHVCWQIFAKKLAELLFIIKEKREAELLMHDAQARYLCFLEDYPGLERRVNQYHIASYLNITAESLSRIRSHLKKN